jgi:nitrate/TMAO reductase-like tetraheme cytochrome c subunit
MNAWKNLSKPARIAVVAGASLLVLLGTAGGFIEYSTSPRFCNSCHIMQPFVKAWETSTHKDIGCVECHYPPDDYWGTKFKAISQVAAWVTGTYSTKPYAEIDDKNCLACHTTRLLRGVVEFKEGIKFDHKPHLLNPRRGKKLKCTTCHSQIVQGEHLTVNERVCFICHFKGQVDGIEPKGQEFCTKCHMPPPGDIQLANITYNHKDFVANGVACQRCHLEVVSGDGRVPQHACWTCHGEPERVAKYGDTEFLHEQHVTNHKVECDQCHEEIVHKVKTRVAPLDYDCGICHTKAHAGIKSIYMGTGGKGVPDSPSPMYQAQVDCIGCHIDRSHPEDPVVDFGERTLFAAEKGCTDCHGEGYEGLMQVWVDDVAADLEKTRIEVEAAQKAIDAAKPGPALDAAKKSLDAALYNYHFVKSFHGAHNPDYAAALLAQARKDAAAAVSALQGHSQA